MKVVFILLYLYNVLKKTIMERFSWFVKATKVETELLKETNKFLKNATNLNPLMKWYKKKFWTVSPKWLLIEAEIRQINIQIDWDWIHIQGLGTDGVTYDELAFFDYDSAKDMAQLVAGTYIKSLEEDKKFYQDMLNKTRCLAIDYAKLPPEDKKNAVLPNSNTELLDSNPKTEWAKQKKQSKKRRQ